MPARASTTELEDLFHSDQLAPWPCALQRARTTLHAYPLLPIMMPAVQALHHDVQQHLSHKRDDRAVTPPGKEWSRGWDDLWK